MLKTVPLKVMNNDGVNEGEKIAMTVNDAGRQRVEGEKEGTTECPYFFWAFINQTGTVHGKKKEKEGEGGCVFFC